MSDFQNTELRLAVAALSPAFDGTPQEFIAELVRLSSIVSPTGIYYIVLSDTEPTSNKGMWLKDGTKPYVWDETTSGYIPADLTDSLTSVLSAITALQTKVNFGRVLFSSTEPASADRTNTVWIQLSGTTPVAVRYWDGVGWTYLPDRFPHVTTAGTANAHTASLSLVGASLASLKNRVMYLRPGTTNNGPTTLAVNGTDAKALRVGSTSLSAGQFAAGNEYLVVWDGTYYQLLNPSLPDVTTASTYSNLQSLTVDAKGRVTAATSIGSTVAAIKAAVVFDGDVGASVTLATKTVTASASAANTLTIVGHGWSNGQLCWVAIAADGTGSALAEEIPYYVRSVDADTIQLFTTKDGAINNVTAKLVDITTTASGLTDTLTHWVSSPMLGTPVGVDGVIAITDGSSYFFGIDFTTDQATAHYVVSGTVKSTSAEFLFLNEPEAYDCTASLAWVCATGEGSGTYGSPSPRFRISIIA